MEITEDLKIEIRPIPGRNDIKKYSENLEYYAKAHTIGPFVNPQTMKYESGLTEKDREYLKKIGFPHNIDENYLRVPHEFWESQAVRIGLVSTPMFLYPGKNTFDYIKWKYLLKSKYVYSSEAQMKTGTKLQATHYIYDESEETEIKASALERKNNLLLKVTKLTSQRKKDLILIITDEDVSNKADNYLTVKIDEILKDKSRAMELETLLDANEGSITIKAEVKKAIRANVLKKTQKGIMHFETNLGFGVEDVVKFLSDPENQDIYLNIKSKL